MSKKRPEWLDEILKPENLSAAKPAVHIADFLTHLTDSPEKSITVLTPLQIALLFKNTCERDKKIPKELRDREAIGVFVNANTLCGKSNKTTAALDATSDPQQFSGEQAFAKKQVANFYRGLTQSKPFISLRPELVYLPDESDPEHSKFILLLYSGPHEEIKHFDEMLKMLQGMAADLQNGRAQEIRRWN